MAAPVQKSTSFTRQNDKVGLTYLKAAYYCLRRSDGIKYFTIFTAVLSCIAGITNKYLHILAKLFDWGDLSELQADNAVLINLIAGIILIINIAFNYQSQIKHKQGINLMERFDAYVFGLPLNLTMMRPISSAQIEIFSHKVRRKNAHFENFYFDDEADSEARTACYDFQAKEFEDEYRLMLSTQPFFLSLWIGFAFVVFMISISVDDKFITTLSNVIFPSLSIISMIVSSWHGFNEQMRRIQNCIRVISSLNNPGDRNRVSTLTNITTLRSLQDGLFYMRLNSFTIPRFLVRRHERRLARENWISGKSTRDLISLAGYKPQELAEASRRQQREAATQRVAPPSKRVPKVASPRKAKTGIKLDPALLDDVTALPESPPAPTTKKSKTKKTSRP